MATTGKNFASLAPAFGTAALAALDPRAAAQLVSSGTATLADKIAVDLSQSAWAKTGAVALALATSTPQTVDLTAVTGASTAGDVAFASVKELILTNAGAHPVTVSPGASNGWSGPLGGTAPTFTLPANSQQRWHGPAGWAVDSTHKNLTFDPGAFVGSVVVCLGGS